MILLLALLFVTWMLNSFDQDSAAAMDPPRSKVMGNQGIVTDILRPACNATDPASFLCISHPAPLSSPRAPAFVSG